MSVHRDHSDTARFTSPAARRRYLTIVFSDLCDSTQLGAAVEAEHYGEILGELRRICHRVVAAQGGTVVRMQGDGLLAIFGHPEVREDDVRRAVAAALELHREVRALQPDPPLPCGMSLCLHTGIHAGLVLIEEGDVVRGRFELLGNAPNTAARLSNAAVRDEILVSDETLGADRPFFQTGALRLLGLKGREDRIAARSIVGRAEVASRYEARARRGLTPFVGREAELEALDAELREAIAGRPRFLAVAAAAGVGKTRLVEEFVRRATRDVAVHRGYCDDSLGAEPLQPFLQMLRALFGIGHATPAADAVSAVEAAFQPLAAHDSALAAQPDALLRALAVGAPGSPGAAEATIGALRALFEALAATRPILLLLDDWQWADDASRQALAAIRRVDAAIFVLVATRGFAPGDADMSGARILDLAPLADEDAERTIARLRPGIDPFVAAAIRADAGGNPLYLEELCHGAAHLVAHAGRRTNAAWLDVLVESRVARLPPPLVDLVRTAAVIGNVVPAWLLEQITGFGADHPLVRELAASDFLFPGEQPGTLRFKHGITRDVVYAAVGLHERKAMHLRIAEALREHAAPDEACEALAYHYGAAGSAAEAAHYAELAGDKAVAASALDRGKRQYHAALAALDRLPRSDAVRARWGAIVQRLGLASVFDASRDELRVFRRAVAMATESGDVRAVACAEYWLGYINYSLGESRDAVHHCERSLAAALRVGDDPLAVQVRAVLGQARAAAGDYDGALALLDEAIAIKRRHRSGSRPAVGLAYTLACKAYLLGDRGDFREAHACFADALDAVRGAQHEVEASIRGWQSAVLLWQGRWADARDAAEHAAGIAERVHCLFSYAMSRAAGAYAQWMLEGRPESLQAIADATAWLEPGEGALFRSLNYGWLADALATTGRSDEARRRAACAIQRARRHDRIGVSMAYRALARIASDAGRLDAARRYVGLALRNARLRGSAHDAAATQACAARIELSIGDAKRGRALLVDAAAEFERMDMRWHLAELRRIEPTFDRRAVSTEAPPSSR